MSDPSIEEAIGRLRYESQWSDDTSRRHREADLETILIERQARATTAWNDAIKEAGKVADDTKSGGEGYYGLGWDDACNNIATRILALSRPVEADMMDNNNGRKQDDKESHNGVASNRNRAPRRPMYYCP